MHIEWKYDTFASKCIIDVDLAKSEINYACGPHVASCVRHMQIAAAFHFRFPHGHTNPHA